MNGQEEQTPHQPSTKEMILSGLQTKSAVKQKVFDVTYDSLNLIREILHELELEVNSILQQGDKRLQLESKDRGEFETEVKIAGDVLIFSMHSNIFVFDRDHSIWKNSYVQKDKHNAYCGVINIYNFLADSFKYGRLEDLGYLVGRIFINQEGHYFVEGKRQMGFLYNDFGNQIVSKEGLSKIVETAMLYAIEFDLLVPPYDAIKMATVGQMNYKIDSARFQTGKRLGFKFNSDDVLDSKDTTKSNAKA